jgi:hypothetical protein
MQDKTGVAMIRPAQPVRRAQGVPTVDEGALGRFANTGEMP